MAIYILVICISLVAIVLLAMINYKVWQRASKYGREREEKTRVIRDQKSKIRALENDLETKNQQICETFNLLKGKNEDIANYIRYAVQIQNALLPEISYIRSLLPNSFVLYEPKDIVSGDFYWTTKKNGQIVLSVADCTGHGVTGAFMSILGITALNEIVTEKGITQTDQILNLLREKTIWALQQGGELNGSKDSIHLVVCAFDPYQNKLQFSGAINSILLVRESEILQYKGDRMPISLYPDMDDFKSTTISLQKNDMIYLFSNGYYGQFGGDEDRKFGMVRFRSMAQKISNLPIFEQQAFIENTLRTWKGNSEQVDDILVMGFRV